MAHCLTCGKHFIRRDGCANECLKQFGTITFASFEQVVLFEHELRGQISDGHWENARPHDHWHVWCDAHVGFGPYVGRDFDAKKCDYNFTSPRLLEVVGERMCVYVRLARTFGLERVELLKHTFNLDDTYIGMPTYPGDYYDDVREKLASVDLEKMRAVVEDESIFSRKDLMRELREMKKIIKLRSERRGDS